MAQLWLRWSLYPVAVYMFRTTVESASISLSPMGVRAAWTAGPITNPRVWKSEKSAVCCVRSFTVVTFEMYARAEALIAKNVNFILQEMALVYSVCNKILYQSRFQR